MSMNIMLEISEIYVFKWSLNHTLMLMFFTGDNISGFASIIKFWQPTLDSPAVVFKVLRFYNKLSLSYVQTFCRQPVDQLCEVNLR